MNTRGGWWTLGIVAVAAAVLQPALAHDRYFSTGDETLRSSDLGLATNDEPAPVTYTAASGEPYNSGPTAYIDYLHWGAHRQGMDIAILSDSPVAGTNVLRQSDIGFGRDGGVRVGLGYQFEGGWEASWNYAYFSTDGRLLVDAAAHDSVTPTQLFNPFATLGIDNGVLTADARLNYNVNDLEVGRWFAVNETASLRLFGGFRWAIIDQRLNQAYEFDVNGADVAGSSVAKINMSGYGLRLGSEGRWGIGRGFSLFGKGAVSVLSGHFSHSSYETWTRTGVADPAVIDLRENTTQIVPVLEAAAGVNWTWNQVEITAGYELAGWLNMANRYNINSPVGNGFAAAPSSNDLLLDGLFLRLAYTR
jgi:hypothetical protein